MTHDSFASCILIHGPGGKIPLILNPKKPRPHFWKFPGGRSEYGETPAQTAAREAKEETGLEVGEIVLLDEIERITPKQHTLYFFGAEVKSFDGLLKVGETGEIVTLSTYDEIVKMMDFFGPHRELLDSICTRA